VFSVLNLAGRKQTRNTKTLLFSFLAGHAVAAALIVRARLFAKVLVGQIRPITLALCFIRVAEWDTDLKVAKNM
jgi:hypothetical protein